MADHVARRADRYLARRVNIYRNTNIIRQRLEGLADRQREREAARMVKLERLWKWQRETAAGTLPLYNWVGEIYRLRRKGQPNGSQSGIGSSGSD